MVMAEDVLKALKEVYDPEIPVNVVDLGLIYDVQIQGGRVDIKMTLTFPGCGVGPSLAAQAEALVQGVEGVEEAHVDLVFSPPWTPDKMSDEAKMSLGFL